MGWEMRHGRRVYYRKVREGSRVRSVYCGTGARGEAAAREDQERRACAPPSAGSRGVGKESRAVAGAGNREEGPGQLVEVSHKKEAPGELHEAAPKKEAQPYQWLFDRLGV